ncbi:MAG: cyclase family protein, partial [Mesorhizobium sp.]
MGNRWNYKPEGANWGLFGADDEVGRLNLITDDIRLKAAAEIRTGRAFCLSLPLDLPGGTALNPNRKPPRRHVA